MKTKNILIILVLSLVWTSCSAKTFKSSKKTIEMMENPTTGYTWLLTVSDESIINVEEDVQYLGKEDMVGAPTLFTYSIKSVKPGNTSLKFEYKRPWEDKPAEQILFYEVKVQENGKIKMNKKKATEEKNTYKSVSMSEGLKLIAADTDYFLLDVRRPDEYAAGHIPGAVQLTNETMTEQNTMEVLPNKSQRIYVYCRSGRRSKEASQKLVNWGYSNVVEIGGILEYSGALEK